MRLVAAELKEAPTLSFVLRLERIGFALYPRSTQLNGAIIMQMSKKIGDFATYMFDGQWPPVARL